MIKRCIAVCAVGLFVVGPVVFTTGCGGPGPVVKGKATNSDFAKTNVTDRHGNKVVDGVERVQ